MEVFTMTFTETEAKFLKSEFGLTVENVLSMSESELDKLYDDCIEIEIAETYDAGDSELSERGQSAVGIVDALHGEYDSTEYDNEMQSGENS
jgi:hypothetical protein